jgi:hypothetical protein
MKSIKRIAAGAFAVTAVLTPAAARADTPYAQASALVESDGTVAQGKNITDAWHPFRGAYCLTVNEKVDLKGDVAVHVTPVGKYDKPRSLSVEVGAATCGEHRAHTIAVYSQIAYGTEADVAFYLTVS